MYRVNACAALLVGAVAVAAYAGDPDTREILTRVNDTTKALKAVYYEAEWFVEGPSAGEAPKVSGAVWIEKTPADSPPRAAIVGQFTAPDTKEPRKFHVATDSKVIARIDESEKTVTRGEMPAGMELLGQAAGRLYFQEYNHPTPFDQELEGESKYEGSKTIGGADCHVIYVTYAEGMGEARWYFGKQDNLPRRVDRIFTEGDNGGAAVLQITKLDTSPKFTDETFNPKTPAGYEEKKHTPRARPTAPELLKVGGDAPDWELQTPAGDKVSLKSLRGKVVVLDFWATWCGPCKRAMPGVQKLHEEFKGKPVAVIGMNCWERGGDPAAYMKEKGYTYMLLLKADEVAEAYKVSGIPTFYVIGPDGKIAFADTGMPGDESALAEIIKKNLPRENE